MNSELDRTHDPFDDPKARAEFEAFLDSLHEEMELGQLEMEMERVRGEIGDF